MIFTISQIKKIEEEIDENCLIAFDLDNTLITSCSYFGSVSWVDSLIAKFEKEGLSYKEAYKKASVLWNQAQYEIKIKLIEEESSKFIKKWKKKSAVVGLTARCLDIKDLTYEVLKYNNISFSSFLENKLEVFHEGVLYCSDFLKSQVLLRFIDEVLIKKPKKIIFVDDKKENLDDILNSKVNKDFKVKCYHYLNDPYKDTNVKI